MGKLQGKVALITGGTTGIGFETARLFVAEGARITVTGSTTDSIAAAQAESGPQVEVMRSDAGSDAEIKRLAQHVEARGTGLDILFLNAGVAKFVPIVETPEELVNEHYRINALGPLLAIKHFAKLIRRGGSIVVNTSVNNIQGMPGTAAYAASKSAARSIVQVAANELSAAGIRVNAVSPGPIETPLIGKLGLPQEVLQGLSGTILTRIPLKRFGKPAEIARAVLFLATDDASYITGEELAVDGGMTRV